MKRPALFTSFMLFIALCASGAYWGMQFFQPPPRAMIAPPSTAIVLPDVSAAAGLLGGRVQAAAASNFQLTGIILADHPAGSLAIIAANGKPARPFRVRAEIQPGVSVQEVQRNYVLLSDHGASKRLDLPVNAKTQPGMNLLPPTKP